MMGAKCRDTQPRPGLSGPAIKSPVADATGLISLFLEKEVTANSVAGYRNIIVIGSGSVLIVIIVLLASKSLS
jgi:hypothetical protein